MENSDQDLGLGSNRNRLARQLEISNPAAAAETKMYSSQGSGTEESHSQSSPEDQIEQNLPSQPQPSPSSPTKSSSQPSTTEVSTQDVTRPVHGFDHSKQEPLGQTEVESNDKQRQCNCKKSTCLNLNCGCLASGSYCNGCNCFNCHNNLENEASRGEAIAAILKRNPAAFNPPKIPATFNPPKIPAAFNPPKITASPRGCKCKKSGCLKYYNCECYKANMLCSENCRCQDCKNFQGSQERKPRKLHRSQVPQPYTQEMAFAVNNAINNSINMPYNPNASRKRKEAARDSSAVPHVVQNQAVKNSSSDEIKQEQTSKKHKPESRKEPDDEEQSHGDSSLGNA